MKNLKRLKISGLIIMILLVLFDIFITIFRINFLENEDGQHQTGDYANCGQESKWERRVCLARDIQKEYASILVGNYPEK